MILPNTLKELKTRLESERQELEEQLSHFATKDPKVPGDWDTKFPQFESSMADSEDSASEVTEYEMLLDVEHNLELQLKAVNEALLKIESGDYGICAKCGEGIPIERLKANPSSATCIEHV